MTSEARPTMAANLLRIPRGQAGNIHEPIPAPAPAEQTAQPVTSGIPVAPPLATDVAPPPKLLTALTVRIEPELAERLRVMSFRTRRAKGDLIAEALTRFLDAVEGK
jgi:hypothetical protein